MAARCRQALVKIGRAVAPLEAVGAVAVVTADLVHTGSTVLAGVPDAVVFVVFTVGAFPAWSALTDVALPRGGCGVASAVVMARLGGAHC